MIASPLLSLLASILCVFLLFVASTTSLSYFFPTQLAYGPADEINQFYFFLKVKMIGLPLLSLAFFIWLVCTAKKRKEEYSSVEGEKVHPAGFLPWGLVYVLLAGGLTGYILFTTMSGGDEGVRTNTARNLVLYSLYALGQPGSFQIFSPIVSTGPTVILPLVLLYKYVGDGTGITRIYELGWNLPAFAMLYLVYARMLRGWRLALALFLSIIFLLHPRMEDGYATLMGDTAVLFFLLAALFFLPDFGEKHGTQARLFLSSFFLGMAVVTKLVVFTAVTIPFIALIYWFNQHRKIAWRHFLASVAGIAAPLFSWMLIKQGLTNTSFSNDNMYLFSSYALFGIRGLGSVIIRYGVLNFLKLSLLVGATTFFMARALKSHRESTRHLAIYIFSISTILFFFFCTHGQIVRYNLHAILLLIPLAVNTLPDSLPRKGIRNLLVTLPFPFVLLFHEETRNLAQILSLRKVRELPWLTEQLREKIAGLSAVPTIWTFDEYDGCYLSALIHPPVFWMRETMFYAKPRPIAHPFQLNQTNIVIPQEDKKRRPLPYTLPALKPGDLIAVGVTRKWNHERKLYLLTVTHVPDKKTIRFIIQGHLPEELDLTLRRSLSAMGLQGQFILEGLERDKNAYWLEPWQLTKPGF